MAQKGVVIHMPDLSHDEIKAILRGVDGIILQGGRTLLAKILKGSKEKKVLELGLDKSPVYGYYRAEKLEEVMRKIGWMLDHDFLDIEYQGKLPMIVFTERGWLIEVDQMADELIYEWKDWIHQGVLEPDMLYLKDRNREMILLMLEKIKESGNKEFIAYLNLWEKVEYKKVRAAIRETINLLEENKQGDSKAAKERNLILNEALLGSAPQDLLLKCYECGDRFTFSIGEQQFFKQKGFALPKRCSGCRESRELEKFFDREH